MFSLVPLRISSSPQSLAGGDYFNRLIVTGPLKLRTDIFAPPSPISAVSSEPRPNRPAIGLLRETLLVMLPAMVTTENDALVLSGIAMSIDPLWVSKSKVPLRSSLPAKLMLPVTVSIFVRSNTPPPPSTLIGPLTVENAASELVPRKVMVPDALFALTHGGEPEM